MKNVLRLVAIVLAVLAVAQTFHLSEKSANAKEKGSKDTVTRDPTV